MENIGHMQATPEHEDVFSIKALGENFSDIDDIEDVAIGMRGLYAGDSRQAVGASIGESSPSSGAEAGSADHDEWDLANLQGHA
jgi:hypothetical protein